MQPLKQDQEVEEEVTEATAGEETDREGASGGEDPAGEADQDLIREIPQK